MASDSVLDISQVSKRYRLGLIGTGTLSGDLRQQWQKWRGQDTEAGLIGLGQGAHVVGDQVWALRDVNLNIKRGEVVGLIGKNGAGKSTLLKLLSRVTAPSKGRISIKGRMVSLLEVGTGMHPELTGRDNIFLNGAILGMSRSEIQDKYDEIVEFSGCEAYIDTPVKRYSSGMKVRLGFSVAAFLDPDILIVDEVLAVGDADFQKKAISRIREVSHAGQRTVIIVSHNMASVRSICTRCILLDQGQVAFDGDVVACISMYLGYNSDLTGRVRQWDNAESAPAAEGVWVKRVALLTQNREAEGPLDIEAPITFECEVLRSDPGLEIDCTLRIFSEAGDFIASSSSIYAGDPQNPNAKSGACTFVCEIPGHFFNQGIYKFGVLILLDGKRPAIRMDELFKVALVTGSRNPGKWMGESKSLLLPKFNWTLKA